MKLFELFENVYHGTQSSKIEGTPRKTDGTMGHAFYLTSDKVAAEMFGRDKTTTIDVGWEDNPRYMTSREADHYNTSNVFEFSVDNLNIIEFKDDSEYFEFLNKKAGFIDTDNPSDVTELFQLSGYDGVKIEDVYAIYSPEKLKMV